MKEIFFGLNAVAAFAGWLAFNVGAWSLYKDQNESTFNLRAYVKEHYDNWIGSLLFIPAFLWMGAKGFDFKTIGVDGFHWSDAYYVASGFFFEAAKEAYKKWRAKING